MEEKTLGLLPNVSKRAQALDEDYRKLVNPKWAGAKLRMLLATVDQYQISMGPNFQYIVLETEQPYLTARWTVRL